MSFKRAKNISEVKQKLKGSFLLSNPFEWTTKQQGVLDILNDKNTKCMFLNGPAGVGKTQLAIYSGLQHLQVNLYSKIIYIRSIVESSHQSTGYLPGTLEDKLSPFMEILEDKLSDIINETDILNLKKEGRIESRCISHLRGKDFKKTFIIVDEAQNITFEELKTIISRVGENCKIIFLFDPKQSDLKKDFRKNDIVKFSNIFKNNKSINFGIFYKEFVKSDIMRSDFCKFVMEEIDSYIERHQE
jgi:predicted ribonuclease YlaK